MISEASSSSLSGISGTRLQVFRWGRFSPKPAVRPAINTASDVDFNEKLDETELTLEPEPKPGRYRASLRISEANHILESSDHEQHEANARQLDTVPFLVRIVAPLWRH
jgi:hypothetical protein